MGDIAIGGEIGLASGWPHTPHEELAKSGCHALAILSDNRGEGGKIAAAGGVRVLLPVLHTHPKHVDLHRVEPRPQLGRACRVGEPVDDDDLLDEAANGQAEE